MNVKQISAVAKSLGINPSKFKKTDLIRVIQRTEGNFDCFAKAYSGECDQHDCTWRSDCFKSSATKSH
jgi:hypothetical protein